MAFNGKQRTGSKFFLENKMIERANKFDVGGMLYLTSGTRRE
jgi:hypothetical protein